MIKVSNDVFELQIIKALQKLNLLFALCPWSLMMDGIKFNLTCLTLHDEHMEPTMLKLYVYLYTQIVELDEFTFVVKL